MLTLWGDTETNGHLNSFFIQEAWATMGYLGLVLSPFVVALSISLSISILAKALSRLANYDFIISAVFALIMKSSITGGFSGFPLMRILLVPLIVFVILALVMRLIEEILRKL